MSLFRRRRPEVHEDYSALFGVKIPEAEGSISPEELSQMAANAAGMLRAQRDAEGAIAQRDEATVAGFDVDGTIEQILDDGKKE